MTTTQWETVPEIKRDFWGRPLVIPPEGGKPVAYTRCTTFVSCLEDTYNLGRWQMRMVARGLSIREDLALRVNSLGPEPEHDDSGFKKWKSEMDKLTDQAVEAAKASGPANTGTALHALTERIDRGQKVEDVPRAYRPHLKAYQEATEAFTPLAIEQFMVNDELQVGGTPDRIVKIDGLRDPVIADIKTGSIEFGMGKIAMQLAMYAHSHAYEPGTGARSEIIYPENETSNGLTPRYIDETRGVVIALDAQTGACQLHWVDLTAGWEAIQLCTQVRAWRARKDLAHPYTAPTPTLFNPPPQELDAYDELAIYRAITNASTNEQLIAVWQKHEKVWTPAMTERAAARKAQLTTN